MSDPELVTPELLRQWRLPGPEGSKDARGAVVIVGGAASTPGAVALAGLAALRAGAGRVQLAVAESAAPALAVAFPEAGVVGLAETGSGSVAGDEAAATCAALCEGADAVLVGPGLDDGPQARVLLSRLVPRLDRRSALVLDAYALGVLDDCRDVLDGERDLVLTPNSKEMDILLRGVRDGAPHDGALHDDSLCDDAVEVARSLGCAVTVQGVVADRDGRTWRIPSGHSGLATAGSGDVLAGLVTALLGRGCSRPQATCWGTYLHSTAGERLASEVGGVGFLARELVDQVPRILAELG